MRVRLASLALASSFTGGILGLGFPAEAQAKAQQHEKPSHSAKKKRQIALAAGAAATPSLAMASSLSTNTAVGKTPLSAPDLSQQNTSSQSTAPATQNPTLPVTASLPASAIAATAPSGGVASPVGASIEPRLAAIFAEIEKNRLDKALSQTESLLQQYPNFRLAHLIKGDLLLARSQPLQSFGAAPNAPAERVSDLRAEAIARLKAYREKPSKDYVPRYLLQMEPDQRYAVVVDTQKSRLYLYENDRGRPRFVADYYITDGKEGASKVKEGDKKTPIGVYHVTSAVPRQKLGDFYGSGAFPINYPNEWDKRQGRNGHGIWLHGVPSDTFSRPPKASDGCVVLANQDLDALARNLQVGLTPVIISNEIEWLSLDDWQAERGAFNKKMEEWRSDWESLDVERYLRHYSRRFQTQDQNFDQFARQKRQVTSSKEWVKVKLANVSLFRNPGKEEVVVVTFEQDYRSNNLSNQMKKRQYWIREDGSWKIIYEGAA